MNSAQLQLVTAALLLCLTQILPQSAIAQVSGTPRIAQSVPDREAEADITAQISEAELLFQQGFQHWRNNQQSEAAAQLFKAAVQSWHQVLALCQENGDRHCEAAILNELGGAYHYLKQDSQSLESHQQALNLYREIDDRADEGDTLWRIGEFYRVREKYSEAAEFYQQALPILREVGDLATEYAVLNNLGTVYVGSGHNQQALEVHQQALRVAREGDYRRSEELSLNHIAALQSHLGQYSQALESLQQQLEFARERNDRAHEGDILNNAGLTYWNLAQYPKALEHYQQALSIRQEIGEQAKTGHTLAGIGLVYKGLGQYSRALDYYQQALSIAQEVGDREGEGVALNNLGELYRKLEQYPQALDVLQQSLAIQYLLDDREGEGTTLNNIGLVYVGLGKLSQGLDYLQQALSIAQEASDRTTEGAILGNMGTVYASMGQHPRALEQYQQALVISREVGNRAGEGTTLHNLGYLLFVSGDVEAATKTLFEAVKVSESLRSSDLSDTNKVSLFDTQHDTYDFLQQVLTAKSQPEEALEVSERSRAQAFAELLAKRSSPQPDSPVASVPKPTIAQIKQIAREQNSTLIEYSIAYAPAKIGGREEWQPSKLYIWVVKPTGEINFRSVDLTALGVPFNELLNLARQAIGARGRGAVPNLPPQITRQPEQTNLRLQQLYQVLIDPIADLLPSNPNDPIIFIPQGELFLVPFPALQAASGKYLIQSHTILTAPSIQVLGLTQSSSQTRSLNPSEVLIVGNPTMPSLPSLPPDPPRQLSALSGTQQEAIAIAQQFRTQPLLGNAATETTVVQRMAKARIIHLATHGLLEYGNPKAFGVQDIPGAIALAPSAQDDGLLTSSEILNLKLNHSSVVLSACDTGRGDITGDGVIGLSRSLLSAGASSVIVSLWKVPDDSTAALMTEFYTQLQQQPDRAQALRQAMLKTMAEYPDPIDWAAFTLIGEVE